MKHADDCFWQIARETGRLGGKRGRARGKKEGRGKRDFGEIDAIPNHLEHPALGRKALRSTHLGQLDSLIPYYYSTKQKREFLHNLKWYFTPYYPRPF